MGNDTSKPFHPVFEYPVWSGDVSVALRLDLAIYGDIPEGSEVTSAALKAHSEGAEYRQDSATLLAWRMCSYSGALLMEGPTDTLPFDPLLPLVLVLQGVSPARIADVSPILRAAVLARSPDFLVMNSSFNSLDPCFGTAKRLLVCATPKGSRQSVVVGPCPEGARLQLLPHFSDSALRGGDALTKAALAKGLAAAALQQAARQEAEALAACARAEESERLLPRLMELGLCPRDAGALRACREAIGALPGGEAWLQAYAAALRQQAGEPEAPSATSPVLRAREALVAAQDARRAAEASLSSLERQDWSYTPKPQEVLEAEAAQAAAATAARAAAIAGGGGWRDAGSFRGSGASAGGGGSSGGGLAAAGVAAAGVAAGASAGAAAAAAATAAAAAEPAEDEPTVIPAALQDHEIVSWMTPLPRTTLGAPAYAGLPLALARRLGISEKIDHSAFGWMLRSHLPGINNEVANMVSGLALECTAGLNRAGVPVVLQFRVGDSEPVITVPLM